MRALFLKRNSGEEISDKNVLFELETLQRSQDEIPDERKAPFEIGSHPLKILLEVGKILQGTFDLSNLPKKSNSSPPNISRRDS